MAKRKLTWQISCFGWHGISGVYCIVDYSSGKNEVVYVGQSHNIGKRVSSTKHPYLRSFQNDIPVFIKYKEVHDKSSRINLEKALIKRLKPKFNKQHNG